MANWCTWWRSMARASAVRMPCGGPSLARPAGTRPRFVPFAIERLPTSRTCWPTPSSGSGKPRWPGGFRAALGVPMLRDGRALGAISVGRSKVGPFSEHEISLLRTFADQAVIAIENVRLFQELNVRNRELTESLE